MGIDLYCGNYNFGCSYGMWNEIRVLMIQTVLQYIDLNLEIRKEDHNYETFQTHLETMKSWIQCPDTVFIQKWNAYSGFMNALLAHIFEGYCDTLNAFGTGGLVALCMKSDCEGIYTSGNAKDILEMLDCLEPLLREHCDYNFIYGTYPDIVPDNYDTQIQEYNRVSLYKLIYFSNISNTPILIG
jgi:hypothetical protein